MPTLRKLAVFDIDGTIFRSSLLIELVNALVAEGVFPKRAPAEYARAHARWVDRKDSYDHYIHGVIRTFERHCRNIHYTTFIRVAKKVVVLHKDRVYRYTRDLVRALKRRGYYLLAISHSPKVVIDAFAKRLGFSKVYGMMYETDARGRFTGKVLHDEIVFDKAKILARAMEKEHLTLKGSIGVGDTESDIPFLKLVARPICFNPNKKLYVYAKREGWEVVVERKDVVYTMSNRE